MKNKLDINFVEILQKEGRAQYVQHHILLKMSVEEAVTAGEILGPVRFVEGPHNKSLWLETKGYYSRFRQADRTELRCRLSDGTTAPVVEDLTVKKVGFPSTGTIRIEVTKKQNFSPTPGEFFLYPTLSDYFDRKIQGLLEDIRRSGSALPALSLLGLSSDLLKPFVDTLNSSQIEALQNIMQNNLSGAIQGPPGTGKTQVLQAIVQIALSKRLRVGITGYTHAAVDNALSRVAQILPANAYVRVGDTAKVRADLYSTPLTGANTASTFSKLTGTPQVIAATTHSWALSDKAPIVDVMIVDEAAQIPGYMDTFLRTKARNLILLGDHRQLPPVLVANHGDLTLDLFSLHLTQNTPMLETQYRMNDNIQEWSSKNLYSGKLKAHPNNKDRDIIRNLVSQSPELGNTPVQLRVHDGNSQARANSKEASLVSELVGKVLGSNQIASNQIGIISPHRTHAGAICQALQEKLGVDTAGKVSVDTVERFQGQEKEVIVLAFGADEEGSLYNREGVFLGESRRLNVAVTRAKSRFYCYAPDKLLQYAKNKARKDSALPSFLSWCGERKAA